MFKKLLLTSFLISSFIGFIYPSKVENTALFDYCYSLEKILSRNSLQSKNNFSSKVKLISSEIAKYGFTKSKGALISMMIDQYKVSKDSNIINIIPNKIYCLGGYWLESFKPGIFEAIFYEKSKKAVKEFKDEVDEFLKDINSEYENIKKEFKYFF